jgi:hypothetical protein
MVERAGIAAVIGFKAHPHMLRHACGFTILGLYKPIWGIRTSSIRSAIPSSHRIGSMTSGAKGCAKRCRREYSPCII